MWAYFALRAGWLKINVGTNLGPQIYMYLSALGKGHVSSQCDTPIKCNFCKDKHHAALCLKKFKSVESRTTKGTTTFGTPDEKVKEEVVEKKGSVGAVGVTNFINSGNHVFLQTPKAMCDSPDTIFDSTSQYVYFCY